MESLTWKKFTFFLPYVYWHRTNLPLRPGLPLLLVCPVEDSFYHFLKQLKKKKDFSVNLIPDFFWSVKNFLQFSAKINCVTSKSVDIHAKIRGQLSLAGVSNTLFKVRIINVSTLHDDFCCFETVKKRKENFHNVGEKSSC